MITNYLKRLTKKDVVNHKENKLDDKSNCSHNKESEGALFSNGDEFYREEKILKLINTFFFRLLAACDEVLA